MLCFFGLVTIKKEGKKAPVNIRISSLKFVVQFFYGRVGIGCESFSYKPVSNNRVKMKQSG